MGQVCRKLVWLFPLALLALSPGPEVDARAEASEPLDGRGADLSLSVALFDGIRLKPEVRDVLVYEVESILSAAGVTVEWVERASEPVGPAGPSPEVHVVLLESHPEGWHLGDNVLGAAFADRGPRRSILAFLDGVVRALGRADSPGFGRIARGQREIARALGRVVAHEVIHAVAPDHPHAEEGLMGPRQSRASLLRKEVALDPCCVVALREGLAASSQRVRTA